MYCVKCGVKLQEGIESCPLCQTPVWNPDGLVQKSSYSEKMPRKNNEQLPSAIILTALCLMFIIILLVICFQIYGRLAWGGYPIFGILLFYLIAIFPQWFQNPNPVIFVPVDFVGIALYLWYINFRTGGSWFVSFALPIVLLFGIDLTTIVTLARYVGRGGFYIAGGIIVFTGLASILIELCQSITFNTRMFIWSPYVVGCCLCFGLLLIIAGIYKPLQNFLKQHFFI